MTTVHIVGGGIAGLTLAATLRRPEWEVVVHEQGRRSGEREVGTAFGLWAPAMTGLEQIGLDETVREAGVLGTHGAVRTADDRIVARLKDQRAVLIGRTALHGILREAGPPAVRREDARVEDSRSLDGDLIVGADGVRSVVRRDHWGAGAEPRSPAVTVVRGVVDEDLTGGGATEYWGDGVLFGVTPLPGGKTNWFTAFDERRFADAAEGIAHVRRLATRFPERVREVLAHATVQQTLVNGIGVARPLPAFVRCRSVLIGDAAHAMTPNLGRGACESIRDAVALGLLLNDFEPAEALRRYRWRRLVAPQAIRTASGLVTRLALAHGRAARVRDRLLARRP